MVNDTNKVIYGISENCLTSFGIPSSLIHGNTTGNDLQIDNILPEYMSIDEDKKKNPNGFTTTLDSTVLKQNYDLEGDNGSENESEEDDGSR